LLPTLIKMPILTNGATIRALECPPGREYDEETFLYFLAIERARAERANHRLRLLLATMEPVPGKPIPFPPSSAARLFEGLRLTLRDTDVMGWYRQDRVAGAVLSEPHDALVCEMSDFIEQRVSEGLRQRLPSKAARSLRVRVVQQGPRRLGNG
jgi:hypothetical protein